MGSFTSLVFSIFGGIDHVAAAFYRRLSFLVSSEGVLGCYGCVVGLVILCYAALYVFERS